MKNREHNIKCKSCNKTFCSNCFKNGHCYHGDDKQNHRSCKQYKNICDIYNSSFVKTLLSSLNNSENIKIY